MISVGPRDALLGLGFRGGGEDMDDSELEEGEACSSQLNGYDPNMDPDVALAYIDDKIQDVLGHFQKDFEGGVSAENLGPKFGGYGSFLPSHQRSPVWSHPRTPAKFQSYNLPESPNSLKPEGGHRNNSLGLGTASTLVAPKAPLANIPVKQDVSILFNQADPYPPEQESATKKSINLLNQKTLKVRLKVGSDNLGSDNLSTRKNDIYSGLGLDGTPSSSQDDSSDSGGISQEHQDAPFESPTSILQIMTSCPVYEGMLLSPLPDDLIYLSEKERNAKEGRSVPLPRDGLERSGFLVSGANSREGGEKVSGARKTKSVERNDFSAESKSNKEGIGLLAKDQDIDMFACEELVSKTLKLPLLSNSYPSVSEVTKSKGKDKNGARYKGPRCQTEAKFMEPTSNQEQGFAEKQKTSLAGKVQEDKKASSSNKVLVHSKKDGNSKGDKSNESVKADSNASKGRKSVNAEVMDHSKQKVGQKGITYEINHGRLPSGKEQPLLAEKKKSKEFLRTPVTEFPKDSSRVGSSVAKVKSTPVNISASNAESETVKREVDKSRETYKAFFGEEEESQIEILQLPHEDKLKESDVVAKNDIAVNISLKEKPKGKIVDSHPVTASNIAPRPGNRPVSDAAPATGVPAVIEDNWVNCDKCLKWRLLPHGTNPDHLPEKWLCSMLNWLPGMNRCNVTEEETTEKTKALIAQYLVPSSGSQNNLTSNPGSFMEGVAPANFRHPDQNPQTSGLNAMPTVGKRKNGLKELSKASDKDGAVQVSNSKKNVQASLKSKSLNDVNQSPPLNEPDELSNSSDLAVEKRKHKYIEKQNVLGSSYDGGDVNNLKNKSRRDFDPDSSRASKKMKSKDEHMTDEEWASDPHGADGEVGPSSSSVFLTTEASKDRINDRVEAAMLSKVKDEVCRHDESVDLGNGNRDRPRKRKIKEYPEIHVGSLPTTEGSVAVKEEFSENDCRKEKEARVSRSEGKQSSASKGSGRTDKETNHTKNQQRGKDVSSRITQRSQNCMESLNKDLGSVQVSVAATSSSSKVSGSRKTKSSFQEIKGSPVESVSSSPMRITNPDKHESILKDLKDKDESPMAGRFASGSPRRCSDAEDDNKSERSGTGRKEKFSSGAYRKSESSVLDVQGRDFSHISGGKVRGQIVASPDITNNGALDNLGSDTRSPIKPLASNQFAVEDRGNGSHYNANGSRPRNSGKGYSSRSKDKIGSYESDLDMGKPKNFDVLNEQHDHSPSPGLKPRDDNNKLQEMFVNKYGETEKKYGGNKDFTGKSLHESSKKDGQSNFGGHDGPDVKLDANYSKDGISTPKKLQDCDSERSSKKIWSERNDRADTGSIRGKSLPLPLSGGSQNEMMTCCPRPVTGSLKANGADVSQVDGAQGNDVLKVQIRARKAEAQNGNQHSSSRHLAQNGHRSRDLDAPSPARRDSSTPAFSTVLKEARELKHLADRLKSSGSNEHTGYYFQAVLKFLHAASLLESSSSESAKQNDPMQIYKSTATLCQWCAHEFEKSKDMASAALAFKCSEVAYMKVIYSSNSNANRDRHELQTALPMVPPGESPSSSASDVDNLNNPSTVDKVALQKDISSPQVAGSHVITGRNRPNFVRVLKFTGDVNSAMDASKRSRLAFAALDPNKGEAKYSEGISSVNRALDFNFQDVEGLVRLVRLAMEAISPK